SLSQITQEFPAFIDGSAAFIIQQKKKCPDTPAVIHIIDHSRWERCMCQFSGLGITVYVCMIFPDIKHKPDVDQLLYDRFFCLFKIRIIQYFLWRQKADRWHSRCLTFSAVPFMPGLSPWLPSAFFPVVRNLF